METSMTISVHAQSLGECAECQHDAHVCVTIGKTLTPFCMECAVDSIGDALLNMALASIG